MCRFQEKCDAFVSSGEDRPSERGFLLLPTRDIPLRISETILRLPGQKLNRGILRRPVILTEAGKYTPEMHRGVYKETYIKNDVTGNSRRRQALF
jgi:hypothetical protein